MTIDDFERRFQAGLEAMAHLPLPTARHHYDALCASFALLHPVDMAVCQGRLAEVPIRRYRPSEHRPGIVVYAHGGGLNVILTLISVTAIPVAFGIFALVAAFLLRLSQQRSTLVTIACADP